MSDMLVEREDNADTLLPHVSLARDRSCPASFSPETLNDPLPSRLSWNYRSSRSLLRGESRGDKQVLFPRETGAEKRKERGTLLRACDGNDFVDAAGDKKRAFFCFGSSRFEQGRQNPTFFG